LAAKCCIGRPARARTSHGSAMMEEAPVGPAICVVEPQRDLASFDHAEFGV